MRDDESRVIGIYLTSLQVWDFAIIKNESRLVTGCADSELRVWEIKYHDEKTTDDEKKRKLATGTDVDHPEEIQVLFIFYDFWTLQIFLASHVPL